MSKVGTLEWEAESGGRLSSRERLKLAAAVMPLNLWRALATRAGGKEMRGRLAHVELQTLRVPPSAAATEALQECRSASSITQMYHGMRSFFFGSLIGQAQRISFDADLLCVAALLHDVGLTRRYRYQGDDCHCCAVASGRAAYRISERWRWPESRRQRLKEAIVLHLNPAVSRWVNTEAYLLHAGIAMDRLGVGLKQLPRALVCGLYRRYPRGNFAGEFADIIRAEAKTHPRSRIAVWEAFGLSRAIAADRPGCLDCSGL